MRRFAVLMIMVATFLAWSSVPCVAQDFKPYPGSKLDEKFSRAATATMHGKQSEVYMTGDSFDKVYAFYKGHYKEVLQGNSGPKDQLAFFVVDGSKDLGSSKYWIKIQPYAEGGDGKDSRQMTIIQTVHNK
jgi:hypothetical protein